MPAAWLGRMLDWLRGDRPQPRFLTPFIDIHYEGEDTSPEHDQFTLAEEIADACAISHNLVYDALPLVADFLDWISWCDRTHDAHLQGYRKSRITRRFQWNLVLIGVRQGIPARSRSQRNRHSRLILLRTSQIHLRSRNQSRNQSRPLTRRVILCTS